MCSQLYSQHKKYMRYLTLVILFGVAFSLTGCGVLSLDDNPDRIQNLIEENKEKWEQSGIKRYSFTYDRTAGGQVMEDVYVEVVSSEIDSVSVSGVERENISQFLTVDDIYDVITDAFERDDRGGFQVEFNEEIGYPLRYRVGAGNSTPGEGIIVNNFNVN